LDLYQFLKSGKLEVRVLPDSHFGLIHGKAGVITLADGTKTSFLGSVNESMAAWTMNYELMWEDPSPEAVAWVQEELDALWSHHAAVPLADFVLADIERLSNRSMVDTIEAWRQGPEVIPQDPKPAAVFVESPVYRRQAGLWEHQKYFVKLAFDAHLHNPGGARFVLADQVGLGKTVQLAMAAELMALSGDKPVLILAPKSLVWQWQGELMELLDTPSAVWTGDCWVDEAGVEHPHHGAEGIKRCPRRIGIVPTSRAIFKCEDAEHLKTMRFECVVVDEAHNARRQNLGEGRDAERAEPNNLLEFLQEISAKTKSMLLATATPVQLRAIEAWDLLDVLARGSDSVLGNQWSRWRRSEEAVGILLGNIQVSDDELERWEWLRSPFPPSAEHRDFEILRRSLEMPDSETSAAGSDWMRLRQPDKDRTKRLFPRFVSDHNPFIRHIVRRSRTYLEQSRDPETGEPYLKPINVELHGEGENDAIQLPPYLAEAYGIAEEFCRVLASRMKGAGFLRTLLLRRVGSTIEAGRKTAEKMLGSWRNIDAASLDRDDDDEAMATAADTSRSLTDQERYLLQRFVDSLQANMARDPKYEVVRECLQRKDWLSRGCIVFSQYYDSVRWLAEQLVRDFPNEPIAIYAGAGRSSIVRDGTFVPFEREDIKKAVRKGTIRLMLGTDSASEGLNLQRLGTLINLDLPWNPTRLEQRKGRIQRIGQLHDTVFIYNMRYLGSVEDRVHELLSSRLQEIFNLFGQLPDVLEDAWINVAMGDVERAKKIIDAVPRKHPFEVRYNRVEKVDWESCTQVLSHTAKRLLLSGGWTEKPSGAASR
jgi:superfamily II DNA or RNA helicase